VHEAVTRVGSLVVVVSELMLGVMYHDVVVCVLWGYVLRQP